MEDPIITTNDEKFTFAKIMITLALFILTLFSSYVPWLIRAKFSHSSALVMSYLNCIAGGVVLGALLIHMIPHIILNEAGKAPEAGAYPFGALCAGLAFLLLFAIDKLFLSHSHNDTQSNNNIVNNVTEVDKNEVIQVSVDDADEHTDKIQMQEIRNSNESNSTISPPNYKEQQQQDYLPISLSKQPILPPINGGHSIGLNATKAQAFIFVLALSIHSFLEGLGMGTQNTEANIISYSIGLFSHKWLEAFALGVSIISAAFSKQITALLIIVYSALTPIGILVGVLLTDAITWQGSAGKEIVNKVLNGLAVGSFLFVSCIEMIPPEFEVQPGKEELEAKHKKFKFLALTLGFLFIAAIAILDPN